MFGLGKIIKGAAGLLGAKKSPKVPGAPDLSGNVSNANTLFNTATSNAGQTMSTAQAYNQNAQDTLRQVAGANLPLVQQVSDTARQNLDTYGQHFIPLQAAQADDAASYVARNTDRNRGMATADAAAAAEAQRRNAADRLIAAGVDPGSIHGNALQLQNDVANAANIAGAGTRSVLQTEDTGRQLTQQANNLGLGINQAADQGIATGVSAGSNVVGDVNSTNNSGISNLTAGNTYLNTAGNANNSGANIGTQAFNNEMATYNAQNAQAQQQQGAAGGLLGGIGGMLGGKTGGLIKAGAGVLSMLEDGGPVPEEGAMKKSPIPGSTDRKHALLTPGEFVINKQVVDWKGQEFFHKLQDKAQEEINLRAGIPPPPKANVKVSHAR